MINSWYLHTTWVDGGGWAAKHVTSICEQAVAHHSEDLTTNDTLGRDLRGADRVVLKPLCLSLSLSLSLSFSLSLHVCLSLPPWPNSMAFYTLLALTVFFFDLRFKILYIVP